MGVDLNDYEEVASVERFTKYEHKTEHSTVYEFFGFSNDPLLEIRSISGDQWVARLETNGSFTSMKANHEGFKRSLEDGKRLIRAFGRQS